MAAYLHCFGLGERRRAGVQKLLLADANLLHVIIQQSLHLEQESSLAQHSSVSLQTNLYSPTSCTAGGCLCTTTCFLLHRRKLRKCAGSSDKIVQMRAKTNNLDLDGYATDFAACYLRKSFEKVGPVYYFN